MSRAIGFDTNAIIKMTMETFWKYGLKTTLNDIEKSTGLNRSSIYNSVGDKDELLRLSMLCYSDYLSDWIDQNFKNMSFKEFTNAILNDAANDNFGGRGCLFYNCLGTNDAISLKTKEILNVTYIKIREIFEKRILLAQQLNEMDSKINPIAYATLLMTTIAGIRAFNLSGFPQEDLKAATAIALNKLL